MKTFVIGDIHGAYRALLEVFTASGFDYENDQLICLGDVADVWPEVRLCFDELLKIKNLVYVLGNHDWYLLQWFKFGQKPLSWTCQGGLASIKSYKELEGESLKETMSSHQNLLDKSINYYVDDCNRVFVHGGFNWHHPIGDQELGFGQNSIYTWDRKMISAAWERESNRQWQQKFGKTAGLRFGEFDEIFVGHTPTSEWDPTLRPIKLCNVWALDQGAGLGGKLTLMNVDTHEFWQSKIVSDLYPKMRGRD